MIQAGGGEDAGTPSTRFERPRLALLLAPFAAALAWLIASLTTRDAPAVIAALVAPGLALVPVLFVAGLFWARRPERRSARSLVVLGPCLLAPLAVLAPWAIVPSHLGPAHAGFRYFLSYITRHPTFGPVNLEVLLGTLAVLGASAIPALLAVLALSASPPSPRTERLLVLLQLVPYVPVFLRLDSMTLWYGVATLVRGADRLLGAEASLSLRLWEAAGSASGALLRGLATGAMVAWISRDRPHQTALSRLRSRAGA